jgi:hypothetical protein
VFYPLLSEILSRDQVLLDDMLSIIFVHEHFERSEVLLEAIVVMYSKLEESQDKQGQQKLINFIKNWIKIDKAKFTNPLRDLGKMMV